MVRFDLEQIEGYKAEALPITVTLPQGGVYLLMCALSSMDKQHQWSRENDNLPDDDWDDLDAELSELTLAILTEVSEVSFPVGIIVPYPSTLALTGFLHCNGDSYLRVDYPLLYAVLAAEFITDADNFVVPDLEDRFVLGSDALVASVGATGGADEVTLTIDTMPVHNHDIKYEQNGSDVSGGRSRLRAAGGAHMNTTEIVQEGRGRPHSNMPPYTKIPYYIRAV